MLQRGMVERGMVSATINEKELASVSPEEHAASVLRLKPYDVHPIAISVSMVKVRDAC